MASFDVTSLFTNIPLDEMINLCMDKLFANQIKVRNLTKKQFRRLLNTAVKENHFMFEGRMFDQLDGVAMGSSLGPILANIFMSQFETQALSQYGGNLPSTYRRYVDDTFLVFETKADVDSFFHYMNNKHANIKFTMEQEENHKLPFLDILITRHSDGTITTSVYHKPTFTGLYLRWDSYVPKQHKRGLLKCLLHRAWHICSSIKDFYVEADHIRDVLITNGYPQNFIQKITEIFVASKLNSETKESVYGPEKKTLFLNLPYCGDYIA
jgi:hypothetical protein